MRFTILQLPRPENIDILLNNILLFDTNLRFDKHVAFDIIATLWNKRNNLIENINWITILFDVYVIGYMRFLHNLKKLNSLQKLEK